MGNIDLLVKQPDGTINQELVLSIFKSIYDETYDNRFSLEELRYICLISSREYHVGLVSRVSELKAENISTKVLQYLRGNGTPSSLRYAHDTLLAISVSYEEEVEKINNGGYTIFGSHSIEPIFIPPDYNWKQGFLSREILEEWK